MREIAKSVAEHSLGLALVSVCEGVVFGAYNHHWDQLRLDLGRIFMGFPLRSDSVLKLLEGGRVRLGKLF